jgi:nitrite reductase/ring-hydroxylating ferredoxin subunit
MPSHAVAKVGDLPPGSRLIVELAGRSIGVFNVDGRFYALRNSCPHQGAPLCQGSVGTSPEPSPPGEFRWSDAPVLSCPWHGWEFDLATGRSVFNPHRTRVKAFSVSVETDAGGGVAATGVETFPATVEDGVVVVHV